MRFIMLLKSDRKSEEGAMPDEKLIAEMGKYNEEMVKAGVMLSGEGLQASSKGARIHYADGKRTVIEGPFPNPKELVAGFWIIQVKSKEEAIEWASRCPFEADLHASGATGGGESQIELRQLFEMEDFPPSEAMDRERELREQLDAKTRS